MLWQASQTSVGLQEFTAFEVRDRASQVPVDYIPAGFSTAALQHTNVKLTWDDDDDRRKKMLRRRVTEGELQDEDLRVGCHQDVTWAYQRFPLAFDPLIVLLLRSVLTVLRATATPSLSSPEASDWETSGWPRLACHSSWHERKLQKTKALIQLIRRKSPTKRKEPR